LDILAVDSWEYESVTVTVNDQPCWSKTLITTAAHSHSSLKCGSAHAKDLVFHKIGCTVEVDKPHIELKARALLSSKAADESIAIDNIKVVRIDERLLYSHKAQICSAGLLPHGHHEYERLGDFFTNEDCEQSCRWTAGCRHFFFDEASHDSKHRCQLFSGSCSIKVDAASTALLTDLPAVDVAPTDGAFSISYTASHKTAAYWTPDGVYTAGPTDALALWSAPHQPKVTNVRVGNGVFEFRKQWRLGLVILKDGSTALSLSHKDGKTGMIWKADGSREAGPLAIGSRWIDDLGAARNVNFGENLVTLGQVPHRFTVAEYASFDGVSIEAPEAVADVFLTNGIVQGDAEAMARFSGAAVERAASLRAFHVEFKTSKRKGCMDQVDDNDVKLASWSGPCRTTVEAKDWCERHSSCVQIATSYSKEHPDGCHFVFFSKLSAKLNRAEIGEQCLQVLPVA